MSRTRICTGQLIGCQPTIQELDEIWTLALRGIESENREVQLTHNIERKERVRDENLDKLVTEAGNPDTMSNLTLTARQDHPLREIQILIGPGQPTSVTVEADDHTWALGRYTELMERLIRTRKSYAWGNSQVPQWPQRRETSLRTFGSSVVRGIVYTLSSLGAVMAAVILFGVFAVPYWLIYDTYHHSRISTRLIIEFPISVTIVALLIAGIMVVVAASRSKVVVQKKSFWTAQRVAATTAVTAIVGAIIGVLALTIK